MLKLEAVKSEFALKLYFPHPVLFKMATKSARVIFLATYSWEHSKKKTTNWSSEDNFGLSEVLAAAEQTHEGQVHTHHWYEENHGEDNWIC